MQERKGRREHRQRDNYKKRSNRPNKSDRDKSASPEIVVEVSPVDFGPNDGVSMSDSGTSLPSVQDDSKVQPIDLHKLDLLGSPPISPSEM